MRGRWKMKLVHEDKFLKKFGYKGQERDTGVVGERELE